MVVSNILTFFEQVMVTVVSRYSPFDEIDPNLGADIKDTANDLIYMYYMIAKRNLVFKFYHAKKQVFLSQQMN